MFKGKFQDIVSNDVGLLRGPFGSALKKSLFVPKSRDVYKVYEQGVVLEQNKNVGRYYISQEYFENNLKRFEVRPKDFLVSCSGVNYGAIYQLPDDIEPGVINQALLRIRLNQEIIDDNYFLYYFRTYLAKVITGGTGDSTIPNFPSMDFIKNIDVELPGLVKQRKIGRLFASIDKKINLNNKIISELESMAKTIYDYWFLQFDFPDENGKPYKSSGGKMVWNEELKREIPEGWEVGKVSDICTFENGDRGVNYPSKDDFVNYGIPFITGGMIENNRIIYSAVNYITEYKYQQLRAGKANMRDILLTLRGSLAKCVYSPFDKAAIASALVIVRPKEEISNCFLYHFLTSPYFKELCSNYDNGSVQSNLSVDIVSDFNCCVPDYNTIMRWNSIVEKNDRMIFELRKENQELASLRDWLLPMLMNGQVTFKG